MVARAAVVDAVAASEPELQGLLRDLIAFRTESQAKEATHFPDEARRCIGFVSDFLAGLGFELEGWDVGPSATFPAHPLIVATRRGHGRRPLARVQRARRRRAVGDRGSWSHEPVRRRGRRRPPLRARRDRHEGRPRRGDVGDEDGARAGPRAARRRRLPRRQRRGGRRQRHARDRRARARGRRDDLARADRAAAVRGRGRARPLPHRGRGRGGARLDAATSRCTPAGRRAAASTRSRRR